ncbi:FliM/FliN family flagellar motor switch protein [Croceibacterium sp. LX-88]|jgi:flagellar motor switch protein FliM|uniref:FliM/FliN family flagellar motor switch protein n=1 Tax=Croceibacterium selenioxidans TaxID=2838833 RepID=A0ABS5W137_9SPHN|nr:flagellar motor switch protein FliM [Croceibacterium selenioxidans]MBT2133186.1 FliM/FliN family flagellar motor switch protein [Croceibacterium selenioxidans]
MKPERTLKAAGLAVSHCEALFRQRGEEVDLLPEFGRLGERLARAIAPSLAAFSGGKAPEVRVESAVRMNGGDLAGKILPLAANSLLGPEEGSHRLLLSIDGAAILAQLDRTFGGTGELTEALPKVLPLSADLLAQRLEKMVTEALGQLVTDLGPLTIAERDCSYSTISPYRKAEALVVLTLEIDDGSLKPWTMTVATKAETLPSIVAAPSSPKRRERRKMGPLDDPFASVPLSVEAVLAEMRIPLSRLATFAPGQTIPIPVARAVPLRVGGTIIAKGTVGEFEDRAALQLTTTMFTRKDPQ